MTTTHTAIARCAIHPDLFDLDPHHQFDQLTDDQRDQMNAQYRDAWLTKAQQILNPIDAWLNPATGEIIAPVSRSGQFTSDMRDAINSIDPDEDHALFTAWAQINDQ